jgi:hypothetical protein
VGDRPARSIRAFLVRGRKLEAEGLQDGDHVLVEDSKTLRPHALTLAEVAGRYVIRPASGLWQPPQDGSAGVHQSSGSVVSENLPALRHTGPRHSGTHATQHLAGPTSMLEATYAETRTLDSVRSEMNRSDPPPAP